MMLPAFYLPKRNRKYISSVVEWFRIWLLVLLWPVTGFESLQIAAIRFCADSLKKCVLTDALIAAFTHGKHKMAPFSQDILLAYNVFML